MRYIWLALASAVATALGLLWWLDNRPWPDERAPAEVIHFADYGNRGG